MSQLIKRGRISIHPSPGARPTHDPTTQDSQASKTAGGYYCCHKKKEEDNFNAWRACQQAMSQKSGKRAVRKTQRLEHFPSHHPFTIKADAKIINKTKYAFPSSRIHCHFLITEKRRYSLAINGRPTASTRHDLYYVSFTSEFTNLFWNAVGILV